MAEEGATPRLARRERRREHSRQEIVEAARAVLLREGLAATTLEAVAREIGLTKAALYYYYPSKDALFFEILFSRLEGQALAVRDAVAHANDGPGALRAIISETLRHFAGRMEDFRLVYLQPQVVGPNPVGVRPEDLARIRPLNDLCFGGAAARIGADGVAPRADVSPRLMAFLAMSAAIGVLTYKGMVEAANDPLRFSDEELIEGLARVFEAAARP